MGGNDLVAQLHQHFFIAPLSLQHSAAQIVHGIEANWKRSFRNHVLYAVRQLLWIRETVELNNDANWSSKLKFVVNS